MKNWGVRGMEHVRDFGDKTKGDQAEVVTEEV